MFVPTGPAGRPFQPGNHELKTENLPILGTLQGWKHGSAARSAGGLLPQHPPGHRPVLGYAAARHRAHPFKMVAGPGQQRAW